MFEWDNKFSVEIEKIDMQHKKLFSIGRDLVSVLENTSEGFDQYDEIKKLIKELHNYTVYHFNSEEKLLKEADYIGLPNHKFQHKIFIKKLEDIDLKKLDNDQKDSTMKLLDFIANWIRNHILEIDMKYKDILNNF